MPFRHIKQEADLISDYIYDCVLLQREPDPKFLMDHATSLVQWVQNLRENGTPYVFQPHPSHVLESGQRSLGTPASGQDEPFRPAP